MLMPLALVDAPVTGADVVAGLGRGLASVLGRACQAVAALLGDLVVRFALGLCRFIAGFLDFLAGLQAGLVLLIGGLGLLFANVLGVAAQVVATLLGDLQASIDAGLEVRVFEDRVISPTYVFDAAAATRHLVETSAPGGLYHCVNSGSCTWLELARLRGLEAKLVPVRMADAKLRAARPMYCVLSNTKLASVGAMMPSWQDAIRRYLSGRA